MSTPDTPVPNEFGGVIHQVSWTVAVGSDSALTEPGPEEDESD